MADQTSVRDKMTLFNQKGTKIKIYDVSKKKFMCQWYVQNERNTIENNQLNNFLPNRTAPLYSSIDIAASSSPESFVLPSRTGTTGDDVSSMLRGIGLLLRLPLRLSLRLPLQLPLLVVWLSLLPASWSSPPS